MNDEIKSKLEWRATIIDNSDKLIKHGSSKFNNQFSLFEDDNKASIKLDPPKDINYKDILDKETNVLGVNLTYNIFDRHILVNKRFCNSTIRTVVELTEDANKLIFLAVVKDIEYKKSAAGNNYAKILLQDHDSSVSAFLWGDFYKRKISSVFKDRIYLVEVNYNDKNNSTSIVNIRDVNEVNPEEYISTIIFHLDKLEDAPKVIPYIHAKMFGSRYALKFKFDGDIFIPQYKINFCEEDYLYLKNFITDLTVEK